jgi:hypothetical protein
LPASWLGTSLHRRSGSTAFLRLDLGTRRALGVAHYRLPGNQRKAVATTIFCAGTEFRTRDCLQNSSLFCQMDASGRAVLILRPRTRGRVPLKNGPFQEVP